MASGDRSGIATFQDEAGLIWREAGRRRCSRLGWCREPELSFLDESAIYNRRIDEISFERKLLFLFVLRFWKAEEYKSGYFFVIFGRVNRNREGRERERVYIGGEGHVANTLGESRKSREGNELSHGSTF